MENGSTHNPTAFVLPKKVRSRAARKPTASLSQEQNKLLASMVKNRPLLWSLADQLHKNHDAQASAWMEIAQELQLDVNVIKTGWKSLRDKLRYRMGTAAGFGEKKRSGNSGDEGDCKDSTYSESQNENVLETWNYWDDLKFLEDQKAQRRTISSCSDIESPEVVPTKTTSHLDIPALSDTPTSSKKSNYEYMNRKRKVEDVQQEQLLTGINELIKIRKMEGQNIGSKCEDEIKYSSMYKNLDRMLKKLPDGIVEELNMQFISLAYTALKEYESSQLITVLHVTE